MRRILIGMYRHMFSKIFDPSDIARLEGKAQIIPEHPYENLPEKITENWIKQNISQADILITGWGTPAPLTTDILDEAKNLKLVVHSAGSVKHLINEDFFRRGLRICNTRNALARGVAETTFALVIASLKLFFPCSDQTKLGNWRVPEITDNILEPYKITVGVIAMSEVGKYLLKLLEPFEIKKLVYDPYADEKLAAEFGAEKVRLDELLKLSDAIAVCAPSTPETRHMLSNQQFEIMKPHARIINTSRGAIIDESALIENLRKGRFYAILDVTDPEPPAQDSPLRQLPNCHLLPHIAGHVNNGCKRQGQLAVDEIIKFIETGNPQWEVTENVLHRMA